jgi:pimeloyl-ACP methyl ester carboxylesterase
LFKRFLDNLQENSIEIGSSKMSYISFGRGVKPLVIIPGLSDGLKTIKGTGAILWFSYRFLARSFRVYVFSRKEPLEPGCTTRDMAADLAEAIQLAGIKTASVMGISQGGMISQWLAIDYPEKVEKLAIVISLSKQNRTSQQVISGWIDMAEQEVYDELAVDMMEKSYTETYLKKVRPFYWLIKKLSRPQSKQRFLIQAESCRTHDAYSELSAIKCPTLVLGGGADRIVGGSEVQREMADAIKGSKLHIYPDLGHGAYTEAKDFGDIIYDFFVNR